MFILISADKLASLVGPQRARGGSCSTARSKLLNTLCDAAAEPESDRSLRSRGAKLRNSHRNSQEFPGIPRGPPGIPIGIPQEFPGIPIGNPEDVLYLLFMFVVWFLFVRVSSFI